MLKSASRKHFQGQARAEYLWSLIQMVHNVNESLREPEMAGQESKSNENQSYTSKIKNGISLNEVYSLIEKVKMEVFRGNEDAAEDFAVQKYASENGTFLDARRKRNGK
jgi:hypothetical protein